MKLNLNKYILSLLIKSLMINPVGSKIKLYITTLVILEIIGG